MFSSLARALALACFLVATPSFAYTGAELSGKTDKPVVEVAFVLDTTGSMGPLIEGAKRKIWSIATAIIDAKSQGADPHGLVAYRDIGDEYVTRTFDLTHDIQDLYANLLELKARGGGDWPESVNEALHVGVTKLSWTQGSDICRIMFLVGDAPPHMDYAQDVKYPEVMRMARDRDITVNAVQAGGARDTERVWREIAQMGGGQYLPIPAGRRTSRGHRHAVGHRDHRAAGPHQRHGHPLRPARAAFQRDAEDCADRSGGAVDRLRDGKLHGQDAGRSGEAITGRGDLVADVAAGRQKLDSVKDDELPDQLRALPPPERQVAIDRQSAERKRLHERMAELVKKRDAYVMEQRKKAPAKPADSFDRAVAETLAKQIKR